MFQKHRQFRVDIPSPGQAHIFSNSANTAQMMKAVVRTDIRLFIAGQWLEY
jgi:hypothetical protein